METQLCVLIDVSVLLFYILCLCVLTKDVIFMLLGLISSDSKFNELELFTENYARLCTTMTDINGLLKYFVAEKIITLEQEETIKDSVTNSERVSKLLVIISGPLQANDNKGFYTMLQIMKTYGVDATQHLADQIITRADKLKLPDLINIHITSGLYEDWTKGLYFAMIIVV